MKIKVESFGIIIAIVIVIVMVIKFTDDTEEGFKATKIGTLEDGTPVLEDTNKTLSELTLEESDVITPDEASTAGACLPENGEWGIPGGTRGSRLNSKCGQPPTYEILDKTISTCENIKSLDTPVGACLTECCGECAANSDIFDPSWLAMCKAGCAICCQYSGEPHFAKFGTCYRYVLGEKAIANSSDTFQPYGADWRGYIPAFR